MTDFYQSGSIQRVNAANALDEAERKGLESEEAVESIVQLQIADYERLTDQTIAYSDRSPQDRQHIDMMRREAFAPIVADQQDFVTAQGGAGQVANPQLIARIQSEVAERTPETEQARNPTYVVHDLAQTEPYRYERALDVLYVNSEQMEGNIDAPALNAALDQRANRSPEQLTSELRQEAREFVDEVGPQPSYQLAANRVQHQATQEGWAHDKPRLRDAMVEAALPVYRAASDPANPQATAQERERLLTQEEITEVTAESHPDIARMVAESTGELNAVNGADYAPPTVVISEGHFDYTGSPASFDKLSDTIILDADYVRSNPELDGILGHELGHRYQRDDQTLRDHMHRAMSDGLHIPVDPAVAERLREDELEADAAGAEAAGVEGMRTGLVGATDWVDQEIMRDLMSDPAADASPEPDPGTTATEPSATEPSASATNEASHPTNEQRYQHLDSLLAAEGVERQCYASRDDVDLTDAHEAGPAASPCVVQPQQEQAAAASR